MSHSNRNKAQQKLETASALAHNHDHDYSVLLKAVTDTFNSLNTSVVFQTDAADLFETYLEHIPDTERQLHNCNACKVFLRRYGGLVTVNSSDGTLVPLMWNLDAAPEFYHNTFSALQTKIRRARIVSQFFTTERVWGTPVTGAWSHIAVVPLESMIYKERAFTASQARAASKERFKTVSIALSDFKAAALDEALRILNADVLSRSDRFVAPVRWLRDLHSRPKGRNGENLLWLATALAPEGFCHPRASVVSSLLEMIEKGMEFDAIKRAWSNLLHPRQYQRPKVAPAAANIKQAEELIEKLGFAKSLERRFATLDECETVWKPSPVAAPAVSGGIFAHLKSRETELKLDSISLPCITMTWKKFSETILPNTSQLELNIPSRGNFCALLTAVHADAPIIMKWNNPFSWYVYHNGSNASQWRLNYNAWIPITGIVPIPNTWSTSSLTEIDAGIVLTLAGAVDTNDQAGNALFPECLTSELHGVRATIEAYSESAQISGRENASACGVCFGKKSTNIATLRATINGVASEYHIDRWD